MSDVLNKVVDIVCEQLGADKGDVKSDSSFVEDLDLQQKMSQILHHPYLHLVVHKQCRQLY